MSDNSVIQVDNLSKVYKLYDKPIDRLKEAFHPFKKKYHHEFYALRDVSFSADKGEVVGIIGKNGSGKSTLLQIITGVSTPTDGNASVKGNVSALLELGAGFNPDLTGLENVYFKSSLLGNTAQETDSKIDDILSFADIGEFIFQPVKTYSSGMYVRLAFAVAINVNPDILIIDEALSVGDFRFQQKCVRKIKKFQEDNKTILFVSHSIGSVIEFCTKAVWLVDGKIKGIGKPKDICSKYMAHLTDDDNYSEKKPTISIANIPNLGASAKPSPKSNIDIEWEEVGGVHSYGRGNAKIIASCMCRKGEYKKLKAFEGGERVIYYIKIQIKKYIEFPNVGFHVCDARGVHILGMNTYTLGVLFEPFTEGEEKTVSFEFDFPYLCVGAYAFSPAIAEGTQIDNTLHHWVNEAYLMNIESADEAQKLGHYYVIKDNIKVECT